MDPTVREMLEVDTQANGLVIIAWTDIGSRSMMNQKKTVNTPADLARLKIRCMQDPILADSTNAMGAIATPLCASEIYTGLHQETNDGLAILCSGCQWMAGTGEAFLTDGTFHYSGPGIRKRGMV